MSVSFVSSSESDSLSLPSSVSAVGGAAGAFSFSSVVSLELSIQNAIHQLRQVRNLADISVHTAAIRRELATLQQQIDHLRLECVGNGSSHGNDSQTLLDLDHHQTICSALHGVMRDAIVTAKLNAQKQSALNRKALLAPATNSSSMAAANDLAGHAEFVASLRRTRSLLAQELEKSSATLSVLERSTDTLQDTGSELDSHHSTVNRGKSLINLMEKRERTDKILIGLAFFFFFLVVTFVVWKRVATLMAFGSHWMAAILPFTPFKAFINPSLTHQQGTVINIPNQSFRSGDPPSASHSHSHSYPYQETHSHIPNSEHKSHSSLHDNGKYQYQTQQTASATDQHERATATGPADQIHQQRQPHYQHQHQHQHQQHSHSAQSSSLSSGVHSDRQNVEQYIAPSGPYSSYESAGRSREIPQAVPHRESHVKEEL